MHATLFVTPEYEREFGIGKAIEYIQCLSTWITKQDIHASLFQRLDQRSRAGSFSIVIHNARYYTIFRTTCEAFAAFARNLLLALHRNILYNKRHSNAKQASAKTMETRKKNISHGSAIAVKQVASAIDHTNLCATCCAEDVQKLCAEAKKYRFRLAMVNPRDVKLAAMELSGSKIGVGTVINFPLGAGCPAAYSIEAANALENGADELDLVVDVPRLKRCTVDKCAFYEYARELSAFVLAAKGKRPDATLKLIIECCYLAKKEIVAGCRLAMKAKFDFVKTSTGFGKGGATVEDVRLMSKTVRGRIGVKAAGGIRTAADAIAMLEAGAARLGCSAGAAIMEELQSKRTSGAR